MAVEGIKKLAVAAESRNPIRGDGDLVDPLTPRSETCRDERDVVSLARQCVREIHRVPLGPALARVGVQDDQRDLHSAKVGAEVPKGKYPAVPYGTTTSSRAAGRTCSAPFRPALIFYFEVAEDPA